MNQDNKIFIKDDMEKIGTKSQSDMKDMLKIKKEAVEFEDFHNFQLTEKNFKKETTEKTDTKANLDMKNGKKVRNCPKDKPIKEPENKFIANLKECPVCEKSLENDKLLSKGFHFINHFDGLKDTSLLHR